MLNPIFLLYATILVHCKTPHVTSGWGFTAGFLTGQSVFLIHNMWVMRWYVRLLLFIIKLMSSQMSCCPFSSLHPYLPPQMLMQHLQWPKALTAHHSASVNDIKCCCVILLLCISVWQPKPVNTPVFPRFFVIVVSPRNLLSFEWPSNFSMNNRHTWIFQLCMFVCRHSSCQIVYDTQSTHDIQFQSVTTTYQGRVHSCSLSRQASQVTDAVKMSGQDGAPPKKSKYTFKFKQSWNEQYPYLLI